MASMDDLIATINTGLHAGQQGNDIKELHAKLQQTLQPNLPHYRPIQPVGTRGPHSDDGPSPPPAPASSWNDSAAPPPQASHLMGSTGSAWSTGLGNSPRQTAGVPVPVSHRSTSSSVASSANGMGNVEFVGRRETGFTAGNSKSNGSNGNSSSSPSFSSRPYHNNVLASNASPIDTGDAFANDAFRPLVDKAQQAAGAAAPERRS